MSRWSACVASLRQNPRRRYLRCLERESQKRIVIGANGARIREVGKAARKKVEALVGENVYLDLWVKVLPNWRRSATALERLGYHIAKDKHA